jgi:serine/threonine protein kinase
MRLTDVRRVASQVCLGLESLHARNMLHRDIKPGNILISKQNVAQLGDFGLVTDDLVLGYGSAAGYSDHLPPEVLNGGPTSVKSDIWALGMTLYRLLHGASWYSRLPDNPQFLIPAGGFAASLSWLPHISPKWRRAIRKMMHDDPSQRCPTANAALTALSSVECAPDWNCTVTANEIRWERTANQRRIFVSWKSHSARRHEWTAWSEPVRKGKRHTLGHSGGVVSRSEADRGLREFFAT